MGTWVSLLPGMGLPQRVSPWALTFQNINMSVCVQPHDSGPEMIRSQCPRPGLQGRQGVRVLPRKHLDSTSQVGGDLEAALSAQLPQTARCSHPKENLRPEGTPRARQGPAGTTQPARPPSPGSPAAPAGFSRSLCSGTGAGTKGNLTASPAMREAALQQQGAGEDERP